MKARDKIAQQNQRRRSQAANAATTVIDLDEDNCAPVEN
ncbi:unnamed protein product, partial [Rotaria magnacalcarata]